MKLKARAPLSISFWMRVDIVPSIRWQISRYLSSTPSRTNLNPISVARTTLEEGASLQSNRKTCCSCRLEFSKMVLSGIVWPSCFESRRLYSRNRFRVWFILSRGSRTSASSRATGRDTRWNVWLLIKRFQEREDVSACYWCNISELQSWGHSRRGEEVLIG